MILAELPELVALIYEAALEPRGWPAVLARLEAMFHGPNMLFSQAVDEPASDVFEHRLESGFVTSYAAHYGALNQWQGPVSRLPVGTVVTEHTVPAEVLERSEFINDWMRPQDLYHAIGGLLQRNGAATTQLTVARSRRWGTWTPEEVAAWRALTPHVTRALETHQRLAAAAVRRDAGLAGLEALGTAVLLVDGSGRLLWLNARAEALLAAGDGLAARLGGLAATNALAADRLARLIAEAAGGALRAPRRGGPPLDLLVCPLGASAAAFGLLAPAALIFAHDPASRPATSESALRALWGLSPAEARLLLGLLRGLDLDRYATEAAIAPSTARTLLRRLMRKMGESRQSGVLRAVLANPIARLAAGPPER